MKKRNPEVLTGIIAVIFAVIGLALFLLSYKTGYYIFGEMNSKIIVSLIAAAIVVEIAYLILQKKFAETIWLQLFTWVVTALLMAAALLIVGDRVEGIGNCIITDYDSGHGGEEAIYVSICGSAAMIVGAIFNIIGSFSAGLTEKKSTAGNIAKSVVAAVLAVAVIGAGAKLGGLLPAGTNGSAAETYTITFSQQDNMDKCQSYQFLCSDFSGLMNYDSRLYVDITLELDGDAAYTLTSDCYVIEAGKRAEVGDDTGLGQNVNIVATGAYEKNEDGTVLIHTPEHAVFTMETDTYSMQMKEAVNMNVDGITDDGVYDSNDYPAVLDFVPETLFTLGDGTIESYKKAGGDVYTVSFNQANNNVDGMPDNQFLCSDFSGMVAADSRFYVDVTLTLDGTNYTLFSDSYVIETGKRAEVGDDTGLGLVLTTTATGTYTVNEDGTITIDQAEHVVFEMETDTYSVQMKEAANMNVDGNTDDGVYDSNDVPAVLDFVPATTFTVDGSSIVTWCAAGETADGEEADHGEGLVVMSDDGGTQMTFYPDGAYQFYFESYDITDEGTWTYEDGVLTLTDMNGKETTAEGDPLKLHYEYSQSDQLTGDYTINAADLEALLGGSEDHGEGLVVPSDDQGTQMTFYPDGTYEFYFASYDIKDEGTWTYADGKLTLTDANGKESTAEGDPLKLHYAYSQSDQLTGDYTINAADLEAVAAGASEDAGASVVVPSDDQGTQMTFFANGTYEFYFASYDIKDEGTWTYADGKLTVTDANGKESTAEGDPLKLHYEYSQSSQLTGDYTIAASDLEGLASGGSDDGYVVPSDDQGTQMTFFKDGTYEFYFSSYDIKDEGTWTYADGKLTVTDANGKESTADGDPLKLHYEYSQSSQLTGDYTIDKAEFEAAVQ